MREMAGAGGVISECCSKAAMGGPRSGRPMPGSASGRFGSPWGRVEQAFEA